MAGVAGVPGVGRMINDRAPATAPVPDDAPSALPVHDDAPPVTGSAAGRFAIGLLGWDRRPHRGRLSHRAPPL